MTLKDAMKEEPSVLEQPVDASVGDSAALRVATDKAEAVLPGEYRKPSAEEIKQIVARLRHRGYTNPLFNEVGQSFERANPGWKCVWEYSPPDSKDQHEVMVRASLGYRIVRENEIPSGTTLPHTQRGGPVRVADMILMAAPAELHDAIYEEAARAAAEDAQLPIEEYRQSLIEKGSIGGIPGQALGEIKFTSESVEADLEKIQKASSEE